MKKQIVGKLAAFVVLLVFAVVGTTMRLPVAADEIPVSDISVDYVNETVTVQTDDDNIVYFTETYNKDVNKWDVCEVRTITKADGSTERAAVFDISWINSNKTVRLYLCGDVNKGVVAVDITWEEDFKATFTGTLLTTDITEAEIWKEVYKNYSKFSEDTGYFIFTIEENGRDMSYFPNGTLDSIQWRKGDDGVWRDYDELDLKEMNIRGISLEFRIVADNDDKTRASSIARITVSKLANAPAVAVNANTMSVAIKNGMEFSFDKENWIMVPEYSKKFGTDQYLVTEDDRKDAIETIYTTKKQSSLIIQEVLKTKAPAFTMNTPMNKASLEAFNRDNGDVFNLTDEGLIVYVRDIGTTRKAASKIAEVVIPYAPDGMAVANADDVVFSYGESKTNSGGIVVENKSAYRYQVGVITPEEWAEITDLQNAVDLAEIKWTSVKAGKMLKISNKKVPKDSYLIYRIAAEEGQLPSTYVVYGPMKYDELAYVGIASGKAAAGETLEAVVSTNFTKKADGTYEGLTFQWQTSDSKAEGAEWKNISGATAPTYTLTNDEAGKYVRVVVTNEVTVAYGGSKEIKMESDPEGPVTYVAPEEEEPETPAP